MPERVRRDRECRHELCEMRSRREARQTCVCFCWGGGGVLEGAVEHELGRGAEAARDAGEGGEL